MEWRGRRESSNIEDRRSQGSTGGLGGFGGGSGQRSGGSVGIGGGLGLVAIVVVGWFFGIDLTPLLNGGGTGQTGTTAPGPLTQASQDSGHFVGVVLADTEDVWTKVFKEQAGQTYHPVKLVLFSRVFPSACGQASAATGPFYCPVDKKVYLDTDFFDILSRQLGAGGDFAQAYVVAHEVGHHVQDELGILAKADAVRAKSSETDSNAISVRIELQADCLAGIWAKNEQSFEGAIQPGDFDEAIRATKQIGDDTLQRNAGQVPMPDSFTHGTSAQRSKWFQIGLKSGQLPDCDTFKVANP